MRKSVKMAVRWPAHITSVVTCGHLDRPRSAALLLAVDDPRWDGRTLRWECELDDPQYLRLLEATGCDFGRDGVLKGYPVWLWVERRSGFDQIAGIAPAPAGRSPNGLHWVRLPEERSPETTDACNAVGLPLVAAAPEPPAKAVTSPLDPTTGAFGFGRAGDSEVVIS